MMLSARHALFVVSILLFPACAYATDPKIDADTCTSLRLEQIKFRQSGILDEMNKGATWAKANLSADRLREIEHYLQLDEQVKFGCRDAKLSPEAERASEAAARIEINSDADPTAPVANDPPKPGAGDKKSAAKKSAKKKLKSPDSAKAAKYKESKAAVIAPPVAVQSPSPSAPESPSVASAPAAQDPSLPAFGFGEATVSPPSAP
jgi:hypothetical protein